MILLIETATKVCSVGLAKNGQLMTYKRAEQEMSHASQLTITIQSLMADSQLEMSDLEAVAISIGPGSYTGLRIGLSTAKGICFALNIPLIEVDTLQSLAWKAQQLHPEITYFIPMIDARRMEVYTAIYDSNNNEIAERHAKIIDESSFQELFNEEKTIVFAGNGAMKCAETLANPNARFIELDCSSENLFALASASFEQKDFADMAYIEPFYLKSPNITKPKKIKW